MAGHRRLFLATSIVHLFVEPHVAHVARAASGGSLAGTVPDLPFRASVEAVIENGSIEGYPVTVVRFRSALPATEALALTTRAWRRDGSPAMATRIGAWQVVSLHEADRYRTLQIRPSAGGGSEGLLSVWSSTSAAPASFDAAQDPVRYLPAGARVLRRFDGVDAGRRHRTLVAVAEGSPGWVAQALDVRMTAQGFARDPVLRSSPAFGTASGVASGSARGSALGAVLAAPSGAATGAATGAAGEARLFRRSGVEIAVTVHAHQGRSAIVIHVTETDQ